MMSFVGFITILHFRIRVVLKSYSFCHFDAEGLNLKGNLSIIKKKQCIQ